MACNDKNPLQRDGSSQSQRFLKALDPAYAPIEELGMEDWLTFAAAYADKINYYTLKDSNYPQGDWKPFFIQDKKALQDFLKQVEVKMQNAGLGFPDSSIKSDVEPHLALFMCFIMLLQHSEDALNQFTGRHLDFYFKRVLQLRNRPEVPDKVHVIFELARNLTGFLLPQDTALDAGKDKSIKPKPVVFKTNSELAVNSATIAAMKSWYQSAADKKVAYADVTFSADGLGTPFKDEVPKWNPFGSKSWPTASMGFAFASKVLLLSEGDRTITLTLDFTGLDPVDPTILKQLFKVFLTSEKEWLQADFSPTDPFKLNQQQLVITVNVPLKAKAIVPYDQVIHKENYKTDFPVIRLLMNVQDNAYPVYQALSKARLDDVRIDVVVTGMKNLAIENDNGKLDPSKPFFAFGAVPKIHSNLYIGNTEIFQKQWTEITPQINWKGVPEPIEDYYNAYRASFVSPSFTPGTYNIIATSGADEFGGRVIQDKKSFTAKVSYIKDGDWFPKGGGSPIDILDPSFTLKPDGVPQPVNQAPNFVNQYLYFNVSGAFNYGRGVQAEKALVQQYVQPMQFFFPTLGFIGFQQTATQVQTQTENFSAGVKDNYIRINLDRDFLHSEYPKLFAAAMIKKDGVAIIPSVPYTPEVGSITIDYKAFAKNDIDKLTASNNNADLLADYVNHNVQFFHETPFGQAEQHAFLKKQFHGLIDGNITAIPQAPDLAAFYIGIAGILTGSVASILFQVAEGSEDALAPSFSDTVQPKWYYLSGNEWLALDKSNIISDDTNDFLRSGIIKFLIPDGATTNNTFLNQSLTWLGVELPTAVTIDSVCKFINVHIQAAEAEFADNDNELSHLETGLAAGTISKLVDRLPQIKSITQPYASFGGLLPEDDSAFRLRVSERLRHKHRAITIWDYEHLVMAQFPQVFRVKCLNHTNDDIEVAPGSVRVVAIPDIRNQISFDPFKPRVSKNTLSEITKYLAGLNSMHVDLLAINPDYEEVILDFKVKFYFGFDENLYAAKLNTDVINYLSPWAFNRNADIDFGGILYKSVVIRFIEELPYVDYITDFKMYFTASGPANPDVLEAGNSKAILVSAKQHLIDTKTIPTCP
ncbi:baseplate J/gp47 family protein [Mucilaginibacter angelicae]|uniref:Baseplate J/gp47 family protein n=1 Tax=Mucilaginibacter angelicae TaxID=869718 RepID=A0ABV6L351_9SPHI